MPHVADRQAFDQVAHGRDEFVERLRIAIEVDEDETGKHDALEFLQSDVAIAQLATAKFLTLEDKLILAGDVPSPTMERANDPFIFETAGPGSECGTAMRTDIVVRLDGRPIDFDDQDRLIADLIGG